MNSLEEIFHFPNISNLDFSKHYPNKQKDNLIENLQFKTKLRNLNKNSEYKNFNDIIFKTLINMKETFINSTNDDKGFNSNLL